MPVTTVLGAFWGDEGKGRVSCFLSEKADLCVRFQGGPNAAHTIWINGEEFVFRMIPAGTLKADAGLIAGGAAINLDMLVDEYIKLTKRFPEKAEKVLISERAAVILPSHIDAENSRLSKKIGTTRMGVGRIRPPAPRISLNHK